MSVIGLPRTGIYSKVIRDFFEGLGCKVIMPNKSSQEIINPGVMNSADMMCYPYKVTLGQEIYCLEHGATDLVMFSSHGRCRFKHYHQLQEQTLRNLGYHFQMHVFSAQNLVPKLMNMSSASLPHVIKALMKAFSQIKEVERQAYNDAHSYPVKIGIVGEIYTMIEPDINFDIVRKLQKLGVGVHISMTASYYIKERFKLDFLDERAEKKEAKQLLSEELGGHGFQSIINTIHYAKKGFDGVIHVLPLSCMPESTVESIINHVADKYGIPLYRFALDESNFEQGFNVRLSTFVSMLKRRKRWQD